MVLDLILSPSDSNFISVVAVGDLISDHALVKCRLDFACPVLPKVSGISYRRYHKTDMQKFRDDFANTSFFLSPASTAADLYDQYVHDLGCLIERHAPLICGRIKIDPAGWLSDTYRKAKSVRRQFECMWRKDRSQLSRHILRRQIAQCNATMNRDKAEYYSTVINDNSRDPNKLWQALPQVLNKGRKMTLAPHQSDKSLANQFASFSLKKSREFEKRSWHLPQPLHHARIYPQPVAFL